MILQTYELRKTIGGYVLLLQFNPFANKDEVLEECKNILSGHTDVRGITDELNDYRNRSNTKNSAESV
jgi:hypothetical protein